MFNKVILVGHLTKDVEVRYLNTGSALASSGIATNRRYKKQDGSSVDDVCYIDFKIFGKMAETAHTYLKKGSKVLIEGRLSFETWQDSSGANRSKHSIMVETFQFLDSKKDSHEDFEHKSYESISNDFIDKNAKAKMAKEQPRTPEIDVDDDMPF